MPRYTSVVVALAATLWLLIQARSVLQPFVLAVFIWGLNLTIPVLPAFLQR